MYYIFVTSVKEESVKEEAIDFAAEESTQVVTEITIRMLGHLFR